VELDAGLFRAGGRGRDLVQLTAGQVKAVHVQQGILCDWKYHAQASSSEKWYVI
jgi:hypothetical protein